MQSVSTFQACNAIMNAANAKGDQEMLHVLLGVNNNLIAAQAKYHNACYACYVGKRNIKFQNLKSQDDLMPCYDQELEGNKEGVGAGTTPKERDVIYQAAKQIKEDIKKCQGISLYPLNVNDITLSMAKKFFLHLYIGFFDGLLQVTSLSIRIPKIAVTMKVTKERLFP